MITPINLTKSCSLHSGKDGKCLEERCSVSQVNSLPESSGRTQTPIECRKPGGDVSSDGCDSVFLQRKTLRSGEDELGYLLKAHEEIKCVEDGGSITKVLSRPDVRCIKDFYSTFIEEKNAQFTDLVYDMFGLNIHKPTTTIEMVPIKTEPLTNESKIYQSLPKSVEYIKHPRVQLSGDDVQITGVLKKSKRLIKKQKNANKLRLTKQLLQGNKSDNYVQPSGFPSVREALLKTVPVPCCTKRVNDELPSNVQAVRVIDGYMVRMGQLNKFYPDMHTCRGYGPYTLSRNKIKSFYFGGYYYESMPTNGWNCWQHALRRITGENDINNIMKDYFPGIKYKEGEGLVVPSSFCPTGPSDLINLPIGLVAIRGHAYLKYSQTDRNPDTMFKNFIRTWNRGVLQGTSTTITGDTAWPTGESKIDVLECHTLKRVDVKTYNNNTFLFNTEVPKHKEWYPYLEITDDYYHFYPSNAGQCGYECVIFFMILLNYAGVGRCHSFLDYVSLVPNKYAPKIATPNGLLEVVYKSEKEEEDEAIEFETILAHGIKFVQQLFSFTGDSLNRFVGCMFELGLDIGDGKSGGSYFKVYEISAGLFHCEVHVQKSLLPLVCINTIPCKLPEQHCADGALRKHTPPLTGLMDNIGHIRYLIGTQGDDCKMVSVQELVWFLHAYYPVDKNNRMIHTLITYGPNKVVLYTNVNYSIKNISLYLHLENNHFELKDYKSFYKAAVTQTVTTTTSPSAPTLASNPNHITFLDLPHADGTYHGLNTTYIVNGDEIQVVDYAGSTRLCKRQPYLYLTDLPTQKGATIALVHKGDMVWERTVDISLKPEAKYFTHDTIVSDDTCVPVMYPLGIKELGTFRYSLMSQEDRINEIKNKDSRLKGSTNGLAFMRACHKEDYTIGDRENSYMMQAEAFYKTSAATNDFDTYKYYKPKNGYIRRIFDSFNYVDVEYKIAVKRANKVTGSNKTAVHMAVLPSKVVKYFAIAACVYGTYRLTKYFVNKSTAWFWQSLYRVTYKVLPQLHCDTKISPTELLGAKLLKPLVDSWIDGPCKPVTTILDKIWPQDPKVMLGTMNFANMVANRINSISSMILTYYLLCRVPKKIPDDVIDIIPDQGLRSLCEFMERPVKKLRSLQISMGCIHCRGRCERCLFCDNVPCGKLGYATYTSSADGQALTSSGVMRPMHVDHRIVYADLNKMTNYTNRKDLEKLWDAVLEAENRPIKNKKQYNSSVLPILYEKYVYNSVASSMYSALVAMITRQGTYPVEPDSGYLEMIGYEIFNLNLFMKAIMTVEIPTEKDFLRKVPNDKVKLYEKSLRDFHSKNPVVRRDYDVFVKENENGVNDVKKRKPRIICNPNPSIIGPGARANDAEMRVFKKYWDLLVKEDPMFSEWPEQRKVCPFVHAQSTSQVLELLQQVVNTFKDPVGCNTDVGNFDASMKATHFELDFRYRRKARLVYAKMGWTEREIDNFMDFACNSSAKLKLYDTDNTTTFKRKRLSDRKLIYVFKAKQSTFSGDPLKTTLGNTNRQLHMIYSAAKFYGVLNYMYAAASGDDMIFFVEREHIATFKHMMNLLYARPGETGKKGCGLVLKEMVFWENMGSFLSKNVVLERLEGRINVKYYRQVERLLRTGEASINPTRMLIDPAEINHIITEQIREQTYGDPVLSSIIQIRKRLLPHKKAGLKTKTLMYTAEWFFKKKIHKADYANYNMDICRFYDRDYWLLACGTSPEGILVHAPKDSC